MVKKSRKIANKSTYKNNDASFIKKVAFQFFSSVVILLVMIIVINNSDDNSRVSKFTRKHLYETTDIKQTAKDIYTGVDSFVNKSVIPVFNSYGDYFD